MRRTALLGIARYADGGMEHHIRLRITGGIADVRLDHVAMRSALDPMLRFSAPLPGEARQ